MNRQRAGKNVRKILTTKDINPLGRERQNVPASDSPKESVSNPPPPLPVQQAPVPKKRNPEPVRLPSPWGKKFVIVIPSWNCGKWISDGLQSLANQTADSSDWGVLVLDDASDDNTSSICAKFDTTYIRVGKNIGKAALLNYASHILEPHQIIAELDADDSLSGNAIEIMLNAWSIHEDAVIVYSQYFSCDKELNMRRKGHNKESGTSLDDAGWISHLKTYRAGDLIKAGGLDESIRKSIDKDLVYRLQELAEKEQRGIVFVPDILYYYRRGQEGSITRRDIDATVARRKAIRRRDGITDDAVCVCSVSQVTDTGGPGIFWGRIMSALEDIDGIYMVKNWRDADAMIGNIRFPVDADHQRPWVLRVDGVRFDSRQDYAERNISIAKHIQASEAVIYQGAWGRKMVTEYCGAANGIEVIIRNGVDLPRGWSKVSKKNRKRIIACARWGTSSKRFFKRLEETLTAFNVSCLAQQGYELIVLGEHYVDERAFNYDGIKFKGRVSTAEMWEELRYAAALVHLSWFDCCPNSVIEAMAARVPVVYCCEGVQEIVGEAGVRVADCSPPHPCDISKPYPIDVNVAAEAMKEVVGRTWNSGVFPDVSMAQCAKQYANTIKEAVKAGIEKIMIDEVTEVELKPTEITEDNTK